MTIARISAVLPRLDSKPWGGRKLARYGLDLPAGESIGEALVTAGEARITEGYGAGQEIQQLIDADLERHLGARGIDAVSGKHLFPLLAKLIDASENLSIQVHPNNDGARPLNKLGKTEAWHVLAADEGGVLYVGLKDDVNKAAFIADAHRLDGTSAGHLRAVHAEPGRTILLPAGTVHALGAGVMVYEIQQPSDVTFRLDDWGRVDANGNPRQMHLEQGEQAIREGFRPTMIAPIDLGAGTELLTACRYFALQKTALRPGVSRSFACPQTPQVFTVLEGDLTLTGPEEAFTLGGGFSAVVWPSDEPAVLSASQPVTILRAWVPDLKTEIVDPAVLAGADVEAIRAIAGITGDLDGLL